MQFEKELAQVLPAGMPNRDRLIEKAAQHLNLITCANEYMNLTRITNPREAAIKHIYDSVAPWEHFERAKLVLDAGTGAGFPGIPLAIVLPRVKFILAESVHKKAVFVESAVEQLELENVRVIPQRAEQIALAQPVTFITARAVAPISRLIDLFTKLLKRGSRMLLYKGPDVETELAEAPKQRMCAEIIWRYELPDSLGIRTLVRVQQQNQSRYMRDSS